MSAEPVVEHLSPIDVGDADLNAYLELLDRVLEDRRVTEAEAEAPPRVGRGMGSGP